MIRATCRDCTQTPGGGATSFSRPWRRWCVQGRLCPQGRGLRSFAERCPSIAFAWEGQRARCAVAAPQAAQPAGWCGRCPQWEGGCFRSQQDPTAPAVRQPHRERGGLWRGSASVERATALAGALGRPRALGCGRHRWRGRRAPCRCRAARAEGGPAHRRHAHKEGRGTGGPGTTAAAADRGVGEGHERGVTQDTPFLP